MGIYDYLCIFIGAINVYEFLGVWVGKYKCLYG